MPRIEFEPAVPASERPQTHALDRMANGIDRNFSAYSKRDITEEKCKDVHVHYVKT
jgi:hypothetical protein